MAYLVRRRSLEQSKEKINRVRILPATPMPSKWNNTQIWGTQWLPDVPKNQLFFKVPTEAAGSDSDNAAVEEEDVAANDSPKDMFEKVKAAKVGPKTRELQRGTLFFSKVLELALAASAADHAGGVAVWDCLIVVDSNVGAGDAAEAVLQQMLTSSGLGKCLAPDKAKIRYVGGGRHENEVGFAASRIQNVVRTMAKSGILVI